MSDPKIELFCQQLAMCREETLRVAESVPENNRLKQLKEGKAHPTWLVGHLASTIDTIVLIWMLTGTTQLPKGFKRRFSPDFAGGLPITTNPDDYLPWDEVTGHYRQVMNASLEGIAKLQDSDLPLPLKGEVPEQLREYFTSNGRSLSIMVTHDSYHRGQMGMLAKLSD